MGDVTQIYDPYDMLVGPFEHWHVVVQGRRVPHLTGRREGDNITLVVDGRFTATFPPEHAQQAAWLIAQALAIGAGYSHLEADRPGRPFAPKIAQLGRDVDIGDAP